MSLSQVSVLLYHGTQPERAKLLKQIHRPQGPLSMCPVVVTSFEISMIDRKFLQVGSLLVLYDINLHMTEICRFNKDRTVCHIVLQFVLI